MQNISFGLSMRLICLRNFDWFFFFLLGRYEWNVRDKINLIDEVILWSNLTVNVLLHSVVDWKESRDFHFFCCCFDCALSRFYTEERRSLHLDFIIILQKKEYLPVSLVAFHSICAIIINYDECLMVATNLPYHIKSLFIIFFLAPFFLPVLLNIATFRSGPISLNHMKTINDFSEYLLSTSTSITAA